MGRIPIVLKQNLDHNIAELKEKLPIGKSFDLISRQMHLGTTRACWIGVNDMYSSEIMQMVMANLQDPLFTSDSVINALDQYISDKISFGQTQLSSDTDMIVHSIASGPSVILVDGFAQAVIIDLRQYPARSIEEAENEKVRKGAQHGFVETMLFNANLIRRRIRFVMIAGYMPEFSDKISLISGNDISPMQLLCFIVSAEFGLDLLQYGASHTLGTLITPLSIIGGFVVGEIAINLNWFTEEVIFYTAVTLLISCHKFADARRIYRVFW